MYVIGVCSCVLSFKLIFGIKDLWEIDCQLNHQFSQHLIRRKPQLFEQKCQRREESINNLAVWDPSHIT
jgi:hypothetical protein